MATEPLDALQLTIKSNASQAAGALTTLAKSIQQVRDACKGSIGLKTVSAQIEKLGEVFKNTDFQKINQVADAVTNFATAAELTQHVAGSLGYIKDFLSEFKGTTASVKATTTAIKEIGKAADATPKGKKSGTARTATTASANIDNSLSEAKKKTEEVTKAIVKDHDEATKAVKKSTEEMAKSHSTAANKASTAWSNTVKVLNNAGLRMAHSLGTGIKKTFSGILKTFFAPFTNMGKSLQKTFGKLSGLFRSLARIAMYRTLRTLIKSVTDGLNEGIGNLYQWSLIMDRTFAKSMDSIATSMLYLHNGFASMFSPLINYAAPILEQITNKLVDFFNTVQQIFAALTGASTWTKAIRVQKSYGEAITDTGNAAEKAMHQLMAFDELNVITTPSSGGGSGNQANTPDYGSMFETQVVDTKFADWIDHIRDLIHSGKFRELGVEIGEIFNGWVNRWNSYADGFVLGRKIYNALEAVNGFLETFEFYNFGRKIADWINGLFDGVTPQQIARTIYNIFNAGIHMFQGFLEGLLEGGFWENIGIIIGDTFANIDWSSIARIVNSIADGLLTMFKAAVKSFTEGDGWQRVWEGIKELSLPSWVMITLPISLSLAKGALSMFTSALTAGIAKLIPWVAIAAGGALVVYLTFKKADEEGKPSPANTWLDPNSWRNRTSGVTGSIGPMGTTASEAFMNAHSAYAAAVEALSPIDTLTPSHSPQYFDGIKNSVKEGFEEVMDQPNILMQMVTGAKKLLSTDLGQVIDKVVPEVELMVADLVAPRERWYGIRGGGSGTNPLFKNQMSWNAMVDPLNGAIVQMDKILEQSTVPAKAAGLVNNAVNRVKESINMADLPGKVASVSQESARRIGSADYNGQTVGVMNTIKNAMNGSNLPGTLASAAVSAITAFKNANWAGAGATAGHALGKTFKDHFVANAKSTLMLQTAAGKPLTQAYVVPYANGGYVQGSLFLAGEVAGQAEMVGSINGRTGVASGAEITGIGDAVRQTGAEEASLLRQTNALLQALLTKDPFGTPNSAAGRWIAQSQQAYRAVTG